MSLKRPHPTGQDSSARDRKKQKTADARTIHFQSGPSAGSGVLTNSECMNGLPGAIDVEKFAEARSFEMTAMQSAMETAKGASTQRAWQALPRSLRRRAASHDVRRVPVRLREKAKAEMDPIKRKALGRSIKKKGKSKLVSRTESFLKRQKDKTWLETHMWHAKRMHMKNVWGYRLAETPTQKSYRPSHRSSVRGSILHDASYISTIGLSGKQVVLEKVLSRCCDCQGAGPGAVRYTRGSRIHETHLYKPDAYPFNLIAPITIIWKALPSVQPSVDEPQQDSAQPSNEVQVKSKQRKRNKGKGKAHTEEQRPENTKPSPDTPRTLWIRVHPSAWQDAWDAIKDAASLTLNDYLQERRASSGESSNEVPEETIDIVDLRTYINCFEIMGTKSSQIIKGSFKLNGDDRPAIQDFWNQLKDLSSPGSVPRGMIIGLKIHDPRLSFPPKNAKVSAKTDYGKPSTSHSAVFTVFPSAELARSELWDEVDREGGPRRPKFTKKDLDHRREKNMVPGTELPPFRQDDRIPVMLIQRTVGPVSVDRSTEREDIHGWTILFPAHWGMPFLSSLTFTGTKPAGLRERRTQTFEAGSHDFPFDYPFTAAYDREDAVLQKVEKDQWERKPPAKRVAWETVGTRSPWRADWEVVLGFAPSADDLLPIQREERTEDDAVAVEKGDPRKLMWLLRGPETPEIVRSAVESSTSTSSFLLQKINALRAKRSRDPLIVDPNEVLKGGLVEVKLNICGRGAPDDLAAIYQVGEVEGKEIRQLLSKKLKEGDVEGDADEELSKLSVQDSPIIGYVTTGNYSLKRGRGHAIGAVSLVSLMAIMTTETKSKVDSYSCLVKVKDRDSAVCRVATLKISTL
ncbi:hypothetical protein M422DRAFT_221979 [Sphaerobolus stellatus SS14]|nr:hypothetical protein M422DRAFT_221979 [Sphaerobolus stellatus SS14]